MTLQTIKNVDENLDDYVSCEYIVVGAGVSGLTAAQALQAEGKHVCVFEKARGTGGRLGSKRVSFENENQQGGFDLGASAFCAKTELFKNYLGELQALNKVTLVDPVASSYVAEPRNSALTRHMSNSINVNFSEKISRIEFKNDKWFLFCQTQADARQPQASRSDEFVMACCHHLILAMPAEQASALLPAGHVAESWIAHTESDPVFVSCFIFPYGSMSVSDLLSINQFSSDVIANISLEHLKPGRNLTEFPMIKVTSTCGWAKQHLDKHFDDIASYLFQDLNKQFSLNGIATPDYLKQYTHRWLYSQYSNLIKGTKGYLSFSDGIHIVGDYFDVQTDIEGQPIDGVERAFLSAHKLVEHLAEQSQYALSSKVK